MQPGGRSLKKLPHLVQEQVAAQAAAGQGWPVRLLFQDEARCGRLSDPKRCWARAGVRPEVDTQIVREYEHAFAAVSPHDGALARLVLPSVPAQARGVCLAAVSLRHPNELSLMVLDGAGWHTAKRLKVPERMQLIPLPSWSPQRNPAEHFWDEVREKWFSNQTFASRAALEAQRVTALATLETDPIRVASRAGFD
jgi:DDE superfamily endonuclease